MLKKFFLSEKNMMIAIVLNAFIICLLYFPSIHNHEYINDILVNIDHLFILLFVFEAIVKLRSYRPKAYFADKWNLFDFAIVVLSLPSLMTFVPFFAAHDYGILKVLRLFRMIRLVKLIKFVPRISMIMAGLGRALKASIFVIIVLAFLNFMFALFTCHFFGEIAPEYFGNPGIAAYSIFQLFTVEGWNEIPSSILSAYPDSYWMAGITRFYFVLIVLIGGIFGMSLANAIFVDEMTMDNNQDLEKKIDGLYKEINELKKILKEKG
jgi:voltage-gated sodium channel